MKFIVVVDIPQSSYSDDTTEKEFTDWTILEFRKIFKALYRDGYVEEEGGTLEIYRADYFGGDREPRLPYRCVICGSEDYTEHNDEVHAKEGVW